MLLDRNSQVLKEFGEQIGISNLAPDEFGECAMSFDGVEVQIIVEPTPTRLLLFSALGLLEKEDNKPLVLEKLMEANLYWQGTSGATLGYNPRTDAVVLAYRLDLTEAGVKEFSDALHQFVETAETWIKRLEELKEEGHQELDKAAGAAPCCGDNMFRV